MGASIRAIRYAHKRNPELGLGARSRSLDGEELGRAVGPSKPGKGARIRISTVFGTLTGTLRGEQAPHSAHGLGFELAKSIPRESEPQGQVALMLAVRARLQHFALVVRQGRQRRAQCGMFVSFVDVVEGSERASAAA
jgi:hypothetical protein